MAINILIAGDYCPRERANLDFLKSPVKDSFPRIQELLSDVDYSVVNFETTISSPADRKIVKNGIHLSTSPEALDQLKDLGFNMLTLANNHAFDYGETALLRTIRLAEEKGFCIIGAGKNLKEASDYRVVNIRGIKVAFINACEHEFSIAEKDKAGCNPIDTIDIVRKIKDAQLIADKVIVIIHGGNEHYQLPSPRLKKTYRFFVECGADAVINHHQHCFSGYEMYQGKLIFYGLGNFLFDSAIDIKYRQKTFNYGYMVALSFEDDRITFTLYPYEQCYKKAGVFLLDDKSDFETKISGLNTIIADEDLLQKHFTDMAKKRQNYSALKPYTNRILASLNARGLFPNFISKKRLLQLRAQLNCEAHDDVLRENLSHE